MFEMLDSREGEPIGQSQWNDPYGTLSGVGMWSPDSLTQEVSIATNNSNSIWGQVKRMNEEFAKKINDQAWQDMLRGADEPAMTVTQTEVGSNYVYEFADKLETTAPDFGVDTLKVDFSQPLMENNPYHPDKEDFLKSVPIYQGPSQQPGLIDKLRQDYKDMGRDTFKKKYLDLEPHENPSYKPYKTPTYFGTKWYAEQVLLENTPLPDITHTIPLPKSAARGFWSPSEDDDLRAGYDTLTRETLLECFPGRSWNSIRSRARRLKLTPTKDKGQRRLCGSRVYLAGAMDRVPDGGVDWRQLVTPILQKLGVVVLDPADKPFDDGKGEEKDREQRKRWIENKEYDAFSSFMKEVRGMDLRLVNISDFIILRIDMDVHMCGSYEEMAIANHEKKPILVWCVQGEKNTPWWIRGMIPHQHIFSSFDEILAYLKGVDSGEDRETYNRWILLRKDVLFNKLILSRAN